MAPDHILQAIRSQRDDCAYPVYVDEEHRPGDLVSLIDDLVLVHGYYAFDFDDDDPDDGKGRTSCILALDGEWWEIAEQDGHLRRGWV